MQLPVKEWIVFTQGFGQTSWRKTGMSRLHREVHVQCGTEECFVALRSWKDDCADFAERIFQWRPPEELPRVTLVGYSYGGWSSVLMAQELRKRGIRVETLVLIDPVWRPYKAFPSWLSMRDWWTIKIPPTVGTVYRFYQRQNRPQGHAVQVAENTQLIEFEIETIHQYIDDAIQVKRLVKEITCPNRRKADAILWNH